MISISSALVWVRIYPAVLGPPLMEEYLELPVH